MTVAYANVTDQAGYIIPSAVPQIICHKWVISAKLGLFYGKIIFVMNGNLLFLNLIGINLTLKAAVPKLDRYISPFKSS